MPYYYRTDLAGVTYGSDLYTGSLFYSTGSGIYPVSAQAAKIKS